LTFVGSANVNDDDNRNVYVLYLGKFVNLKKDPH